MNFKRGSREVKAIIKNYGADPLTQATIKWKVNGISQPDLIFVGNINSLDADTVILGSYFFNLNTPYQISAKTNMPNGISDPYPSNDSIASETLYAGVSDTVFIGPTGELLNLGAANLAVQQGGIIDSVYFAIESGNYHQNITFSQHVNFKCNVKVVLASVTGNAEDVVFDNLNVSNAPLILNGVDGLIFRNITFRSMNNAFATAVYIYNEANCNRFEECVFESTVSAGNGILVYSNTFSNDKNNSFKGCKFNNGYTGIYLVNDDSLRIENCVFANQAQHGIYSAYKFLGGKILYNTITIDPTTLNTFKTGLWLDYIPDQGVEINANKISVEGTYATGIRLRNLFSTGNPAIVSNNFIFTSGYQVKNIWFDGGVGNLQVLFNSLLSGGNNSCAIYSNQNQPNILIKNNVAYNKFPGTNKYILQLQNAGPPFSINKNDWYWSGDCKVANFNGTDYNTLLQWQVTGHDLQTINENPGYLSDTNLHSTSSFLNGTAQPTPGITRDIDGDPRDTLLPDIGADEFTPVTDDVGILAINGPNKPFPSGVNYVYIKFQNNGIDTLTSMAVNWSVNGILQAPYLWTGILPSAATYDSLDIGQYNFTPDIIHDLKVWVGAPNGVADQLSANDTMIRNGLYPALNGTYTIGGSNPDYEFISEAMTSLNLGGAFGDVYFNLRAGIYSDTLVLHQFPGSSCNRKIVIQSENQEKTSVVINNLGFSQPTIQLNGVDGITFKQLTIESINPVHRRVVVCQNGANCNIFDAVKIKGLVDAGGFNPNNAVFYSPATSDTANLIKQCEILGGNIGLYDESGMQSWTIENNLFNEQAFAAIYSSGGSNLKIKHNIIRSDIDANYFGMHISQSNLINEISSNDLLLRNNAKTGIFISNSGNSATQSRIFNNFINISTSCCHTTRGVHIGATNNLGLYFNTIRTASANNNAYQTTPVLLEGQANTVIKNNILASIGDGYSFYTSGVSNLISDNNNFYKSTVDNLLFSNVGYNNLNLWQAATTLDSNSFSINPEFISSDNLHTHLSILNGQGQSIVEIGTDIDAEMRAQPPDIGADEFDVLPTNDAGVFMWGGPVAPFAHGNDSVQVVLKNFGGNVLNAATIKWVVNGIEQTPFNWTGTLETAACDTVNIGIYDFFPTSNHQIIAWTELPNGNPDSTNVNDTLMLNNLYPALVGTYTLGGFLPDFNQMSFFQNSLKFGGVLGNVTLKVRPGIYAHNLQIEPHPGSNAAHWLTICSETQQAEDVILKTQIAGQNILTLNNTQNITISKVTILCPNEKGIECKNGTHHINIEGCTFEGSHNGASFPIYTPSTREYNLSVKNNLIKMGYFGFYSQGGWTDIEDSILISNNVFQDQLYSRLYLIHTKNLKIAGNIFKGSANQGADLIYLYNIGIGSEVSANRIFNSSLAGKAVHIVSGSGLSTNFNRIFNNYIYHHETTGFDGIFINTAANWNIDHNSVYLKSGTPISIFNYPGQQIKMRNNIFMTQTGGKCFYIYQSGSVLDMDYNNHYTDGAHVGWYFGQAYNNLSAFVAATPFEDHGYFRDPLFVTTEEPKIKQSSLNGGGIYIEGIETDIDSITRGLNPDIGCKEFTPPNKDAGIKKILEPNSGCDLGNEHIFVSIQNYGQDPLTDINIVYGVDEGANIMETLTNISILPGDTLAYLSQGTFDMSTTGVHQIYIHSELPGDEAIENDSLETSIINIEPLQGSPTNLLPANGSANHEETVSLSWLPVNNATVYDIYVWKSSASRPSSPTVNNISIINTTLNNLEYGEMYSWQAVAKNSCSQETWSDTNQFVIRQLPDILVDTVIGPETGFSGQNIIVEYQINNQGLGSSQMVQWFDAVYLSSDQTLNPSFDYYLGSTSNLTALMPGATYVHNQNVQLPNGVDGAYYLIIYTDYYNHLKESSNNNNTGYKTIPLNITLTPPSDLRVISATIPTVGFSGESINYSYSIKNLGTGNTPGADWKDRIVFRNHVSNTNQLSLVVQTLTHTGVLMKDSSYVVNNSFQVPENISGIYEIEVITDAFNQIYEFASEGNNGGTSNSTEILLTPPPDLVPDSIHLPDTIHLYENFNFSYQVKNQGGSIVEQQWADRVYLSKSPIYNPDFFIPFTTRFNNPGLAPTLFHQAEFDANASQTNLSLEGDYYMYIFSDFQNQVNEWVYEGNNIKRSSQRTTILQPDIKIEENVIPNAEIAGTTMDFSYILRNTGEGILKKSHFVNRIYLSTDTILNLSTDILLLNVGLSHQNIDAMAQDTLNATVTLPEYSIGNYYIIILADQYNDVFESNENNNIFISEVINIFAGNTANLTPSGISVPDTLFAGVSFGITYQLINSGNKNITAVFADSFFISYDSIWNRSSAVVLGFKNHTGLDTATILNLYVPAITSFNQTTNVYYLYIQTDSRQNVFEGIGEANNLIRSGPLVLLPYPPIDINLTAVSTVVDTIEFGIPQQVEYTIRNDGLSNTFLSAWQDRIFLSIDTLLGGDTGIQTINYNQGVIDKDSIKTILLNLTIPLGTVGDYYIYVVADVNDANKDVELLNNIKWLRKNGVAHKINIRAGEYPDLIPELFSAPVSVVAGQNFDIILHSKNVGETTAGERIDKVFLSSDATIGFGDLEVLDFTIINHPKDSIIKDTISVFLPINYSGNYFVIYTIDHNQNIYEYNKESNNKIIISISIQAPLLSDLIVQEIIVPNAVTAGKYDTIQWKTKNQGINPSIANIKEIIYLSSDSIWDVGDKVIGIKEHNIALSPNQIKSSNYLAPFEKVSNGNYHTIIRTDSRNNVSESNEYNNTTTSIDKTQVDIEQIFLNLYKPDSISNTEYRYYKLWVGAENAGKNLWVSLKGDSIFGQTEMYIKYGTVPTKADNDVSYSNQFAANQEVLIRDIFPGFYYISISGSMANNALLQQVGIIAEIRRLHISEVNPQQGSNKGKVTMIIEGAELESLSEVELVLSDTTRYYGIPADTFIELDNGSKVVARFNLEGKELGKYHVLCVKPSGYLGKKLSAFEIIEGEQAGLQVTWRFTPDAFGGPIANTGLCQLKIDVENIGDVDVENQEIIVSGPFGENNMYNNLNDFYNQNIQSTLIIIPEDEKGLPGILKPKGKRVYYVYGQWTGYQGFTLRY
ncbi:MAG: right-handed parallel beta-helix repeat-containing protein [Saprospiraceae bacterium]|nr:right-handed parallel beta-helix repeat-containing protein [Saprospiraceae bacterium]